MIAAIIVGSILGLLIIVTLIGSFVAFRLAYYNKNDKDITYNVLTGVGYDQYHDQMIELIKGSDALPYETVSIKSFDGLTLKARLYVLDEKAPIHIQFHGYRGQAVRDFSGGVRLPMESGHNVLLVDQRAHGNSEGHIITFGVKERKDVASWVEYVVNRFGKDCKIALEGISMGAATVLMASNLDMPNVKVIFADCPYSSPIEITMKVSKEMGLPKFIAYPFLYLGALIYAHFNLKGSSAVESVKDSKYPILIVHGGEDRFVPIEMSRKLKKINPNINLEEFPGAAHGMSYLVDMDRYKRITKEFENKYLN